MLRFPRLEHGVIFLWLLMLSARMALAAESLNVSLEVVPATVKLGLGETRQVMVVAHNASIFPIKPMRLDWLAGQELLITNQTSAEPLLAAGTSTYWLVNVTKTDETFETDQVQFRLDYQSKQSTNTVEIPDLRVAP